MKGGKGPLPVWLYLTLAVGGILAAGIHLGKMSVSGAGAGDVIKAAAFLIFGCIMLRGALAGGDPGNGTGGE